MKTLIERTSYLLELVGNSQTELAKIAGVKPPSVNDWLSGKTKSIQIEPATKLGKHFKLNPMWISKGTSPMRDLLPSSNTQHGSNGATLDPINIEQAPGLRGRVPLISFVQAGAFAETIDNFNPGDADEWVDATCPVNRHTFALRVVGDSMEPDFPAGTILIIEPELSPEQNDFVIAKNGDNEATFKQLTRDGADWYLKPLNPRYPIKPLGTSRVIGVVRDAVRKFR